MEGLLQVYFLEGHVCLGHLDGQQKRVKQSLQ